MRQKNRAICWNNSAKFLRLFVVYKNFAKIACVAGVNRRGRGARTLEKNGVQGARDEGTPATKTPIFSSPPTDF